MDDDDFYERARRDLFPKAKDSSISITILSGEPDPKLCMELGAMILFDKPIIVVAMPGTQISAALKRVASAIVITDLNDPSSHSRITKALTDVLANDARSKHAKRRAT